MNSYKIIVTCFGRFHFFDLAKQLQEYNYLALLVHTYPTFFLKRWGLADTVNYSFVLLEILKRFANLLFPKKTFFINYYFNILFDLFCSKIINKDYHLFIGLSSLSRKTAIKSKKIGVKVIIDHASLYLPYELNLINNELIRLNFNRNIDVYKDKVINIENVEFSIADRIVVPSQLCKQSFLNSGVDVNKIMVNHLGVDISNFVPGDKNDKKFRIIYCGGIYLTKGVHNLIEAFKELNFNNSELWIVGKIPNSDYFNYLNTLSLKNVYFKGAFPQSKLATVYNQASVFVLPSISDGFGMVVAQALACGIPTIVTPNVGAKDIIQQYKNGIIANSTSSSDLAAAILSILDDSELYNFMKHYSKSFNRNHLSWEAYGLRQIKIIDELMKS